MDKLAKIKEISLFQDKDVAYTPLSGGLNNEVFKVTTDSSDFAVKFFNNEQATQIASEAQKAAYEASLAPQVILVEGNVLVSTFCEGRLLSSSHYSSVEKVSRLSHVAAMVHQIDVTKVKGLLPLNLQAVINGLIDHCPLKKPEQELATKAINLLPELAAESSQDVFVHGDLNVNNILIIEDNSNYVIDFESAAIAPISYELGMIIAINRLSQSQLTQLMKTYLQSNQVIEMIDNYTVTRYGFVAAIINGLWYRQQAKIRNVHDYERLAIRQFRYANDLSINL